MADATRQREALGLDLVPGDAHYRAYVGPPRDYDLVAAMTFGLLTCLGLRQHHTLLDIGCGSLRVGRLLIPYLNEGHYTGLEPNRWLVDEGVGRETGRDQIEIKRARFLYADLPNALDAKDRFDFALAQSIFSHAGLDLVDTWLSAMTRHLEPSGALLATFVEGADDHCESGWVYPDCVTYRRETLASRASQHRLQFKVLGWHHPRQAWALFARPDLDLRWLDEGPIGWNTSVASGHWD